MISVREIEKKYAKLMENVKTDKFYTEIDLTNRVNCYVCTKCSFITKTKDIDAGVTPMMHSCNKCGKIAKSTFYKDIRPQLEPIEEWYRPTLKEVLKMRKKEFNEIDHVLSGGLINRKI